MKIIVFDTETTSLKPGQICQLAYLIVENGEITGKNMFFTVDDMDERSQSVHGFSMEMLETLSEGKTFSDRVSEINEDFLKAEMIVGHNVAFDIRFLKAEFERCFIEFPKVRSFCTMNYFTGNMMMKRKFQTYRPKPPKLIELKEYFSIEDALIEEKAAEWFGNGNAQHDARFDTAMTYLCLKAGADLGMVKGIL